MDEDRDTGEDRDKVYPDVSNCIFLIFIGWGASTVLGLMLFPIPVLTDNLKLLLISLGTIAFLIGLGLRKRGHATVWEVLGLREFPLRILWPVVLISLSLSVLISELDNIIQEFFPAPDFVTQMFVDLMTANSWTGVLEVIFFIAIVAPVGEELLFRGLFQYGLVKNRGRLKGVFYSSLFFAVFHMIPWQAFGAFPAGLTLGFIALKANSVFPSILAHGLFNLLPIVLLNAGDSFAIPGYNVIPCTEEVVHTPLSLVITAAFVFSGGMYMFSRGLEDTKLEQIRS